MLRRFSILALALAAVPALAGPAAAPPQRSAADLRRAIQETQARVDWLLAKAHADPDLERIETYRKYAPPELQDRARRVKVDDLFAILANPQSQAQAREAATDAFLDIKSMTNDPDLSVEGKGARRPRAAFCLKVAKLLTEDDDVHGRSLAKRILETLWPAVSDQDAVAYDPRKKPTWREGKLAWEKFLRK